MFNKLICSLFGHLPEKGYAGGVGYFKVWGGGVDGVNRHHLYLECNCERCGETYRVGNVHVPNRIIKGISDGQTNS